MNSNNVQQKSKQNDFPYKYEATHPYLQRQKKMSFPVLMCYVIGPFLYPVRIVMALFSMGTMDVCARLLGNLDNDKPMSGFRLKLFDLLQTIFWNLMLLSQFLFVIKKNKKIYDKDAKIIVSNHRNMLDVAVHGVMHHPAVLGRSDIFHAFGIGSVLRAKRSIPVDRTVQSNIVERMRETCKNQKLLICPEGTCSSTECVVRFRRGAFMVGEKIQPVAIHYRTLLDLSWLCQSGLKHLMNIGNNLFGVIVYEYLPVIEGETADEAGMRIANCLKVPYLPYTNMDYLWFSGKGSDMSKCSKEYIEDFGWMGTYEEYKKLCRRCKKNPKYFWGKEELGL